jgi:hypothetical protein
MGEHMIPKRLVSFIHACATRRLAWIFAFLHAAWFFVAIASMGPPSPQTFPWDEGGVCLPLVVFLPAGHSISITSRTDFHDKSVSRGQKISRRALEKRVKKFFKFFRLRFVPLGGCSCNMQNQELVGGW